MTGPPRGALREIIDGAALIEYPEAAEVDAGRAVVALHRALRTRTAPGVLDVVPGARTLLVLFDPRRLSLESLARAAGREGRGVAPSRDRRAFRIPVCYGGSGGPDLPGVAAHAGLTEAEFARRHAAAPYAVGFVGFAPGFAYLRGLPEELHHPRLESPRTRVPQGSVGIGAGYTGIYPQVTPGGWRLIGRAAVRLFDPAVDPPALLQPGDEVAFEAIEEAELDRRRARLPPSPPATFRGPRLFRMITAGLWSSVQGPPRFGHGASGVPPGGAMDPPALADGNARVGNASGAAALEMTTLGPELEALASGRFALAGAAIAAERNGTPLSPVGIHSVREGDRLRLGRMSGGARCYLCVEGGVEILPGPAPTRRLQPGDILHAAPEVSIAGALPVEDPAAGGDATLRIVLSAEADRFTPGAIDTLLTRPWRVSTASDRRGIRLEGERLAHRAGSEIPPEGTALGSIQVPPDGLPILLGPDRPVTGGYPTIGTVLPGDWPRAAQANPGTAIRFVVSRAARVIPVPRSGARGR